MSISAAAAALVVTMGVSGCASTGSNPNAVEVQSNGYAHCPHPVTQKDLLRTPTNNQQSGTMN